MEDCLYKIKREKENKFAYNYTARNSYNQIIKLRIYIFGDEDIFNKWSVEFYIGKRKNKNKSFENCISTGKDGVKSLVWAKKCLIDFISFLQNDFTERNHTVFVYALNSQRMRVYENKLSDLDFKKGQFFLSKKIVNKNK